MTEKGLNRYVIFLVVLGAIAAASYYFIEPNNPGFIEQPFIINSHILFGAAFLVLGIFQFSDKIRAKYRRLHRWLGWVLAIVSVFGVGFMTLYLAILMPNAGYYGMFFNVPPALFFIFAMGKSIIHIRSRDVLLHREWMLRTYSTALATVSQRIVLLVAAILLGVEDFKDERLPYIGVTSFGVAWSIHIFVTEWWIRKTRRKPKTPQRKDPIDQPVSEGTLEI